MKINVIDRNTYPHKGSWLNPREDTRHNFFYYFINPMTMKLVWDNGRQTVRQVCIIGVVGSHAFVKGDKLTLHDGSVLQVNEIKLEYHGGNALIREFLLPRIKEMAIELI